MRKIQKPVDNHSDVFDECISNFMDEDTTIAFQNIKATVLAAGVNFEQLIAQHRLYTYPVSDNIGDIDKVQMNKLYTQKLSKAGHTARKYYDSWRGLAERCPLCAVRTVTTLDHYLPKTDHPIFTIFPLNLVPACRDCNTDKLANVATRHGEETLHPYYDDVDEEQWLKAYVEKTDPISFTYYVAPPITWTADLVDRVETHLRVFKLYSLYSFHAAEELSNIRGTLRSVASRGAPKDIKQYLEDAYQSRLANQRNSWQTAMYKVMAEDKWFQSQF